MGYRLGIDVGGTFTDFALYDEGTGRLEIRKVLSTPRDPSVAVLAGVDELTSDLGIGGADLTEAIHATTVATNTVIQRNGPLTALLTTEGFRDVLIIGRQKRWELYDNYTDKPVPVLPRERIWAVRERMLHDGTVRTKLDERAVRRAAREIRAAGVRAVAICFLHSYSNPAHERRAAEIVREVVPELLVTLSSEVSPVYREYERSSTTTLNAYLMPVVGAYVRGMERGLAERGYKRKLFIMQSNGGVATAEVVERFPIRIIESGPAAGVLTAVSYGGAAGTTNLISFDMGGTTAKLCLIESGRPSLTGQFEVDMVHLKKNSGLPINISAIDLVEIGSGGGSIARVEMGAIAVGPQSAGSEPGPICYRRGGTQPTVTDADLVLGYLNADYFLGGEDEPRRRRRARGHRARDRRRRSALDTVAAAWGIHEVVTATMAQAARVVSVSKGKDPRDFVLVPFGGAGPVHGARLARMLGCPRIVFPHGAGVESAIGLLMAEPAFDLARTRITPLDAASISAINDIYRELEAQGRAQLKSCGITSGARYRRSADVRFRGQGYEIAVDLPAGPYKAADVEGLRDAFFAAYAAAYGDRAVDRAEPVELVHFRLTASRPAPPMQFSAVEATGSDATAALKGRRPVYFPETRGFCECPVYDRYQLGGGHRFDGPAVVEERESTVVIVPGSRAQVDRDGNLIVDLSTVQ